MSSKPHTKTLKYLSITTYGYIRRESKKYNIIIPNELIKIIFSFYKIYIDSKILSEDEIYGLYDLLCKHFKTKNIDWNLLWRGSDHGFDFNSFYNKCYNINDCIVIINTKDSNDVFGGYTKVGFKKVNFGSRIADKDAFLCSIRLNGKSLNQQIFPVKKKAAKDALYCYDNYLCCFGINGCAMWIEANCNKDSTNNGSGKRGYEMNKGQKLSQKPFFYVQNMEAFQLQY